MHRRAYFCWSEAKFLDVIGTKVLRVFLLITSTNGFYSPLLSKSGLKVVCNVNIVYGNLKSEKSQDYAQKAQRNCTFMKPSYIFCTLCTLVRFDTMYFGFWRLIGSVLLHLSVSFSPVLLLFSQPVNKNLGFYLLFTTFKTANSFLSHYFFFFLFYRPIDKEDSGHRRDMSIYLHMCRATIQYTYTIHYTVH